MSTAVDTIDPRRCRNCHATLAGCESRRLFSERRCCSACNHEPQVHTAVCTSTEKETP